MQWTDKQHQNLQSVSQTKIRHLLQRRFCGQVSQFQCGLETICLLVHLGSAKMLVSTILSVLMSKLETPSRGGCCGWRGQAATRTALSRRGPEPGPGLNCRGHGHSPTAARLPALPRPRPGAQQPPATPRSRPTLGAGLSRGPRPHHHQTISRAFYIGNTLRVQLSLNSIHTPLIEILFRHLEVDGTPWCFDIF